jgi:hypothetical protein
MGRIVEISVDYLIETPEGQQQTTVGLAAMHRHCRPERIEDLLDDLTVICEDVLAGSRPSLAVVRQTT